MKLSNKKLKYIRRHAESDSPEGIASALRIPVAQVEEVLRKEGHLSSSLVAAGGGFSLPLAFAIFLAVAPFVMTRAVAEATKTPQNAYIQIGTFVFLILVLHLRGPRFSLKLGPRVLGIAAVCFLAWCSLSFAWAMSMREGIERILTYVGIAVLYVVTLNVVRREFVGQLFCWLFGAGVLAALIGLGQFYFGWDFILQTSKPASTFVNKNMACHFMVLTVPLGLYLFVRCQEWWQQALVAAGAAIMLSFVFHTETKGAWLAVTVQSVLLIVLFAVQALRQRRTGAPGTDSGSPPALYGLSIQHLLSMVASVVLLLLLTSTTGHIERQVQSTVVRDGETIALNREGEEVRLFRWKIGQALKTVSETVEERETFVEGDETPPSESIAKKVERGEKTMETSSLAVRLIVWQNTLRMWQDHLLFGVGMGNFRANYDVYARSAVVDTFWPANEWHRTHNDYLQTAAETGLVGALLLLAIIGSLVWIGCQALRDPADLAAMALVIALSGLSINAFFSFPFERTIPPMLFAVYGGLLTLLAKDRIKIRGVSLQGNSWLGCLIAVYALGLILAWGHVKFIRSDFYARLVYNAESDKRFGAVVAFGNKVMEVDPSRVRILCRVGRAYTDLNQPQKSIEVLTDVVDVFPTWYLALHNLAVAYQRARVPEQAFSYADRALELFPVAPETFNVIGCAKLDEANILKTEGEKGTAEEQAAIKERVEETYREAEAIFQKAIDLDPDHHEYLYNKGLATYWQGKLEEAMGLMHQSIAKKEDYALPYKDLGAMYASDVGDRRKACEMFYRALQLDPEIEGGAGLRNYLRKHGITPPGEKAQQAPSKPVLPGPGN